METETQKKKPFYKRSWFIIIAGFVVFSALVSFSNTNVEKQASQTMEDIKQKVATDAVNQYNIAERQGDKIQICVQAMQVSAAYLQAQNEGSYKNWKEIEKMDCARAGMPQSGQ